MSYSAPTPDQVDFFWAYGYLVVPDAIEVDGSPGPSLREVHDALRRAGSFTVIQAVESTCEQRRTAILRLASGARKYPARFRHRAFRQEAVH